MSVRGLIVCLVLHWFRVILYQTLPHSDFWCVLPIFVQLKSPLWRMKWLCSIKHSIWDLQWEWKTDIYIFYSLDANVWDRYETMSHGFYKCAELMTRVNSSSDDEFSLSCWWSPFYLPLSLDTKVQGHFKKKLFINYELTLLYLK